MTEIQIIWLSLLQGITEFLPISSSGHLILFSKFTTFPDQGQTLDIALHVGSIIAVVLYFGKTLWEMFEGLLKTKFRPNFEVYGSRLFYLLLIATIPAIICGAVLKYFGTEWLRNTKLIGWNILFYAVLLWVIDRFSVTIRNIRMLEKKDAFLIGLAQCLALLPGTSRSGITITMARFLGVDRREAAKFSMLMAIPAILAAGIVSACELWQSGEMTAVKLALEAVGYSFIFSFAAIFFLMEWLKKWSFLPFVIYRIALGIILLLDAYNIYDINFLLQ